MTRTTLAEEPAASDAAVAEFPSPNPIPLAEAAPLVQTVAPFKSTITLRAKGREVNAKSIMGVMLLAAGPGREIHARADGDDAEQALDALQRLFEARFGD